MLSSASADPLQEGGRPMAAQPREPGPFLVPSVNEHRDPWISKHIANARQVARVIDRFRFLVERRVEDRSIVIEDEADRDETRPAVGRYRREDGAPG